MYDVTLSMTENVNDVIFDFEEFFRSLDLVCKNDHKQELSLSKNVDEIDNSGLA